MPLRVLTLSLLSLRLAFQLLLPVGSAADLVRASVATEGSEISG